MGLSSEQARQRAADDIVRVDVMAHSDPWQHEAHVYEALLTAQELMEGVLGSDLADQYVIAARARSVTEPGS